MLLNSYLDTAGVWTIGFGHAATNIRNVRGLKDGAYYDGPVVEGVTITRAEALRLFESDIADFEIAVSRGLNLPPGVELAQCQFDALVDQAFQYGSANLLNSTLLRKVNDNPNNLGDDTNHGILWEFSRWNKVAGAPNEAVYRRSCRRALAYAGAPVPAKLWSKGGIPWPLDAEDKVIWASVPTVYQLMDQAKKAATKPKFDGDYPRREPTITIIEDVQKPAEVALPADKTPAVDNPTANVDAAPVPLPPSPPERHAPSDDTGTTVRADSGAGAAGKPPSIETSAAPTLPPVLAPPKPPPVILPKTVDVRSIPYGEIPPDGPVKNMTDSRRFTGMLIVGAGSLIQVLAAREVVSSAAGAIFFDLSRDPVVVAIAAGAVVAIIGQITKHYGTKRITKGMTNAKELLK